MFTGIVQELGTIESMRRARGVDELTIHAPKTAAGIALGESVAVNGACLSVTAASRGQLAFEMIPQTRRLTSLGALAAGDRVNLERSLSLADRLNGHVVLGHIDGTGTVARWTEKAGETRLDVRVDRKLGRLLVPKGPVTMDGVSLTVGERPSDTSFSVFLIPETLRRTTLSSCRAGRRVNIEIDYIAKLIAQFVDGVPRPRTPGRGSAW